MSLRFKAMTDADLDQVLSVENQCHAFPWSRKSFADSLAAGHNAYLVSDASIWIGYLLTMDVLDEIHLLNITVLPEFQRQGRGARILDYLQLEGRARGKSKILLEVRAGNEAALALYRKLGFQVVGQRRGYYVTGRNKEDAIVMAHEL